MHDALGRGLSRARAGVRFIAPERINPDELDSDTAESMALGLIIQGYEFLELPADATWRAQDVKRARIAYKLMKRLEPFLQAHPAGADRSVTVEGMSDVRAGLKLTLKGGATKPSKSDAATPDAVDVPEEASDDEIEVTGEFGMLGRETEDTLDAVIGPEVESLAELASEDSLDQILTGEIPEDPIQEPASAVEELAEEDQENLIARAVDSSPPEPGSATLLPAMSSSRFQIAATLVLVLLAATALVSLVPRLMTAAAPSVDSYGEHLPVIGMVRLAEPEPTLVLIVDESWDRLSDPERRSKVLAAFELAQDRESVGVLVVRDERGRDAVRATADGVTQLP